MAVARLRAVFGQQRDRSIVILSDGGIPVQWVFDNIKPDLVHPVISDEILENDNRAKKLLAYPQSPLKQARQLPSLPKCLIVHGTRLPCQQDLPELSQLPTPSPEVLPVFPSPRRPPRTQPHPILPQLLTDSVTLASWQSVTRHRCLNVHRLFSWTETRMCFVGLTICSMRSIDSILQQRLNVAAYIGG